MNRNKKKIVAIITCIALIIPLLAVTNEGILMHKDINLETKNIRNSTDEKKIALEISQLTGVEVDRILELKERGEDWNEVIEKLSKSNEKMKINYDFNRINEINKIKFEEEFNNALKKEGYSEDEILDVNLIVDRTIFNINQILDTSMNNIEPSQSISNTENDYSNLKKIQNLFDARKAVVLMLKLKNEFGTYEKALDEYLYSLQTDLDIMEALVDKEEYEKKKREKSTTIEPSEIFTLSKIELLLIERIQFKQEEDLNNKINFKNQPYDGKEINNMKLEPVNLSPVDPLDDVMKEINSIKNDSLNIPVEDRRGN